MSAVTFREVNSRATRAACGDRGPCGGELADVAASGGMVSGLLREDGWALVDAGRPLFRWGGVLGDVVVAAVFCLFGRGSSWEAGGSCEREGTLAGVEVAAAALWRGTLRGGVPSSAVVVGTTGWSLRSTSPESRLLLFFTGFRMISGKTKRREVLALWV